MIRNTAEVRSLAEQTIRIHDALRGADVATELVRNPYEEPLAVIARNAFDPAKVVETPQTRLAFEELRSVDLQDPLIQELKELGGYFPLSRSHVYPKSVLDIADLATRAAANVTEGLSFDLKSPTAPDSQAMVARGRGLGLHADYIGSHVRTEQDMPMHGLNVHVTRTGTYIAQLGILRRLAFDERLKSTPATDLERTYTELAAPFVQTPLIGEGDILIFQAEQYAANNIAATVHNFETMSNTRISSVFRPHLGETDAVQPRRDEFTETYGLSTLGY